MNLVSMTVGKSWTALSSSASGSPGALKAQSENVGIVARAGKLAAEDLHENAASSSQARQSDVNQSSSAGRPVATGQTQRIIDKDQTLLKRRINKKRPRREAGDENRRIHSSKQVRQRANQPFYAMIPETDQKVCHDKLDVALFTCHFKFFDDMAEIYRLVVFVKLG